MTSGVCTPAGPPRWKQLRTRDTSPSTYTLRMPPYQLIVLLPPLASTPLWLEMLPSIISTLSIVTAAAVTIYVMIANRRQSILPSLVFYRALIGQSYKWRIKNAGNGLAINIAVCNYSSDGHPVEQIGLYPIACNEEAQLDFITTGGRPAFGPRGSAVAVRCPRSNPPVKSRRRSRPSPMWASGSCAPARACQRGPLCTSGCRVSGCA
jgi:hypothetical protein